MRADWPPEGPKTVTLTGRLLVNHWWLIGMLVSIRAGKGKTLVVIYVCLSVKQIDGARRERIHVCMWTKPKYSESKRCGWTDVFNYEAVILIWTHTCRLYAWFVTTEEFLTLICVPRKTCVRCLSCWALRATVGLWQKHQQQPMRVSGPCRKQVTPTAANWADRKI